MFPKHSGSSFGTAINLIGVFLIHLPSRPLLYLGNLAVYVPSYVIHHTGDLPTHADDSLTNYSSQYNGGMTTQHYVDKTIATVTMQKNTTVDGVFRNHSTEHAVSEHSIQESWFVAVFSMAWMIGIFLSGVIATFIRVRLVIGLGILFQSGSFFVSYFTIDISEPVFFIMLCISIGFGAGLYEGLLLKNYVVVRFNKNTGKITSLVLSSGPLGGVVINQFITWYTNPNNLSPDKKLGEMRIFSQEDIIQRVPSMFLILGGSMLAATTIGFFMLKERSKDELMGDKNKSKNLDNESITSENTKSDSNINEHYAIDSPGLEPSRNLFEPLINGSTDSHHSRDDSEIVLRVNQKERELQMVSNQSEGCDGYDSSSIKMNESKQIKRVCTDAHYNQRNDDILENGCMKGAHQTPVKRNNNCKRGILDNNDDEYQSEDMEAVYVQDHGGVGLSVSNLNIDSPVTMTPLELLKCFDFYKVSAVYIFASSARLFLSVYYKIFGQEWIHDDHFLTNLATAMSLLAVFTTVLWGALLDKIGLRRCFLVIYFGISALFLLMYFCARLNKWAYFFVTLSNSSCVNYLYPVFTIGVIKWFGRNYLDTKLGIIEIFSMAGYVLATFVISGLMEAYGFLAGFIWTSSVHLVGFFVILLAFPKS